jgi:uncharacterized membrane protein
LLIRFYQKAMRCILGLACKHPDRKDIAMQKGIATQSTNPRSTVSLRDHPIHAMLVPVPVVCFAATLLTDIVYWRTAAMLWADISAWLLLIGLIVSLVAAAAGVIDFFGDRRIRELRAAWIHALGNIAALVLSIFNALIHTRDAYTSVVPAGLILSAFVVVILAVTGWNGWAMIYRHGVGVLHKESS